MTQTIKDNHIDFIGDIHGYADKLEWLLCKLGYEKSSGIYRHPTRKVLFLGDFIDRGHDNPRVVSIARKMVEAGHAYAIQGNHEFNAVAFNTLTQNGYLRPHTIKNFKQHADTLLQYRHHQEQYDSDIEWYKTLPIFIETDKFRAVHATWHQESIDLLKEASNNGVFTGEHWHQSSDPDHAMFHATEITCKGLEVPLPSGKSFADKDGTIRHDIRIAWWQNPKDRSYEEMSVIKGLGLESIPYENDFDYYGESERPIFFGHYWLKGIPELLKANVCCLDYSVAKGGYLTAYRWDGEQTLTPDKLVYI